MVEQTAATRIISFLALAACGAWGQGQSTPAGLPQELQSYGSSVPEAQLQELRPQISLPDAPLVQPPTRSEKFHVFLDEARSPLTFGAVGINAHLMRETELQHVTPGPQPTFTDVYKAVLIQKESSTFFGKYLYPSLLKQDPRYYRSTSGTFLGRATYAASRLIVTHNDSGKTTFNTSYFLGLLTSVAIATAYRPYGTRSPSETFKTLGSTIGSDAGMNLWHEFGPGIRQMLKRHAPKFVARIEERVTNDGNPAPVRPK